MELQRASYGGAEFAARNILNIESLEWSAPDLRIPKVIFRDGSEYEINCQGMTKEKRLQMKLSDYFEVILKIDQIAQAKLIVGNEVTPRLARLDGLQINKNGVTWYENGVHEAGTYYRHDEAEEGRGNTTALYNELKRLAPDANFNAQPGRQDNGPQNNGPQNNDDGGGPPNAGNGHQRGAFGSDLEIQQNLKDQTRETIQTKAQNEANNYRGEDDHGHVTWQWEQYANAVLQEQVRNELANRNIDQVPVNKRAGFGQAIMKELREHAFEKFHDMLVASSDEILRDLLMDRAWRVKTENEIRSEVIQQVRDVYGTYMVDDLRNANDVNDPELKEWIRSELRSDTALQRLITDERIRAVRENMRQAPAEQNGRGFFNFLNR